MMSKKLAVLLLFCFSAVVAASDICLPLATPTPTPTPLPACWGAYDADDPRWWDDLVTNDPNTCHCEDSCDDPNEWFVGLQKARCLAGLPYDQYLISPQCEERQDALSAPPVLATPLPTPVQPQSEVQPASVAVCSGYYDSDDPRWQDDLVTNDPNTCHCEDSCDAPNEWSDGWQKARCRAGLQFDRAKLTDQCQVKTPAPHWQQPTNGELESSSTDHSNRRPHEDSKTSDKNTPDKKTPDKKTSTRQTSCSCDAEYEGEALFAVRSHETSSGGLYCDCCYGDDGSNGYVYVID